MKKAAPDRALFESDALPLKPDLALEKQCGGIVCGIDEVGRGPLAGPVVAAAVILDLARLTPDIAASIDDSKKLTAAKRAACYDALRGCARIGIGAASVREIDTINILQASLKAMQRAVRALGLRPDHALVDGKIAPDLACPVRTIVAGDARSLSIAAASIVAKVHRDQVMKALDLRHPLYGWATNVGYGTAAHCTALAEHGATPHHRRSFAPVRLALAGEVGDAALSRICEESLNLLTLQND